MADKWIKGCFHNVTKTEFGKVAFYVFLCLFLSFVTVLLSPTDANAQSSAPVCRWMEPDAAPDAPTKATSMCDDYHGFTNKAVKCISRALIESIHHMLSSQTFKDYYRPIVSSVLVIAITIFALRLMFNNFQQGALPRDSAMFVLKVALVVEFTRNMDYWYSFIVCPVGDLLDVVAGFMKESSLITLACQSNADISEGFTNASAIGVWDYIDCLLSSFLSFNMSDPTNPITLGLPLAIPMGFSLFGLMVASSLSGTVGMALFFAGITALFTMLLTLFRAAYYFVVSILGLCFLFLVSIFVIPCVLFKATNKFFENWVGLVTGYALQPLAVVTFIIFAILIYDYLIFSSPVGLFAQVFLRNVSDVIANPEYALQTQNIVTTCSETMLDGTVPHGMNSSDTSSIMNMGTWFFDMPLQNMCLNVQNHPALQDPGYILCFLDQTCGSELENMFLGGILTAFIAIALVSYMVFTMLEQLPSLGSNLFASPWFNQMPAPSMPFEQNIQTGLQTGRRLTSETFSDFTQTATNQQRDDILRATLFGYQSQRGGGQGMIDSTDPIVASMLASQRANPNGGTGGGGG